MLRALLRPALLLIAIATPVLAVAAEAETPQWYEIATGILAIPAALIGLAYSYLLIKKTRLESRKTELEIVEKERSLRAATQAGANAPVLELQTSENKLLLLLMVRFVVLYLVLLSWGLVEDVFQLMIASVALSAQELGALKLEGWAVIPFVVLQKLPKVLYWVIFFALGWPLFKDANAALGLDLREYLRVFRQPSTAGTAPKPPQSGDNDG